MLCCSLNGIFQIYCQFYTIIRSKGYTHTHTHNDRTSLVSRNSLYKNISSDCLRRACCYSCLVLLWLLPPLSIDVIVITQNAHTHTYGINLCLEHRMDTCRGRHATPVVPLGKKDRVSRLPKFSL